VWQQDAYPGNGGGVQLKLCQHPRPFFKGREHLCR